MFKKLFSVVFAVAFMASGWNSVLAAALCQHQECMGLLAAEKQHTTREIEATPAEHCSKGVEHSEHEPQESSAGASVVEHSLYLSRAARGHTDSCIHCMGAPSTPIRNGFRGEPSQARRDSEQQAEPHASSSVASGVAAFPALRPTQGSPPISSQRRHLLINVFLI